MASLKTKGDLAELKVATDLLERGYRIAIPYGEDHDFDLILCRGDKLERVQVKYTRVERRVRSPFEALFAFTYQRSRSIGRSDYTAATIDWIAVYDETTKKLLLHPGGRSRLRTIELPPSGPDGTQELPAASASGSPSDYLDPAITRLRIS